jgi:predicted dienelactone hydrolase
MELGIDRGRAHFVGAKSHAHSRATADPTGGRRPVLLYSPWRRDAAHVGDRVVEELVSFGYVVVTVDSTGQVPVEFSAGLGSAEPQPSLSDALAVRVQDLRFVLDQLDVLAVGGHLDADRRDVALGIAQMLDLDRVGVFGHPLGGFAAAALMGVDGRIGAGANLNGRMNSDIGKAGLVGVQRPSVNRCRQRR